MEILVEVFCRSSCMVRPLRPISSPQYVSSTISCNLTWLSALHHRPTSRHQSSSYHSTHAGHSPGASSSYQSISAACTQAVEIQLHVATAYNQLDGTDRQTETRPLHRRFYAASVNKLLHLNRPSKAKWPYSLHRELVVCLLNTATHPRTNRAQRRVTSLILSMTLPQSYTSTPTLSWCLSLRTYIDTCNDLDRGDDYIEKNNRHET